MAITLDMLRQPAKRLDLRCASGGRGTSRRDGSPWRFLPLMRVAIGRYAGLRGEVKSYWTAGVASSHTELKGAIPRPEEWIRKDCRPARRRLTRIPRFRPRGPGSSRISSPSPLLPRRTPSGPTCRANGVVAWRCASPAAATEAPCFTSVPHDARTRSALGSSTPSQSGPWHALSPHRRVRLVLHPSQPGSSRIS